MQHAQIIAQNLKTLLTERGISAAELSRLAEVRTSFIYDVLSGKSQNPSTITLARVANALAVPLGALIGNEFLFPPTAPNLSPFVLVARLDVVQPSGNTGTEAHSVEASDAPPFMFDKRWVEQTLKAKAADLRVHDIQDDSMEPTLHQGDVMLVDTRSTTPSPPGIFVMFDGFALITKRVQLLPHSSPAMLSITSDNPNYPPYERDIGTMQIIGRVVWFARRL